jgi:hypothetical protein
MARFMKFQNLLCNLEFTEKSRKVLAKAKKNNTGELSDEDIMKYRQMVNDKNYMDIAIDKIAKDLSEGIVTGGES